MMLSAYFAISWFFLAGADRVRPTALHRLYCLIWLYALSWVVLVAVTVGENNYQIASGYLMVVYNACAFVALLIAYLELFALPKKAEYVERASAPSAGISRRGSVSSRDVLNAGEGRATRDEDDADERTSLLRGRRERRSGNTFTGIAKRATGDGDLADEDADAATSNVYGDEQAWSASLPRWTWIVQFLVLVPINIILVGQVALLATSALHQVRHHPFTPLQPQSHPPTNPPCSYTDPSRRLLAPHDLPPPRPPDDPPPRPPNSLPPPLHPPDPHLSLPPHPRLPPLQPPRLPLLPRREDEVLLHADHRSRLGGE